MAIAEPRLLKPLFSSDMDGNGPFLSTAQRAWLKIVYGAPLSSVKEKRGWSELDYFYASQGHGDWDELGYLKSVRPIPYVPKEYKEAWGVCGIRAGKALSLGTLLATPRGYLTMGCAEVGDELIDMDGKPTKVTFVTEVQHARPCYRLLFYNKTEIIADEDHQWVVSTAKQVMEGDMSLQVHSTRELYAGRDSAWVIPQEGRVGWHQLVDIRPAESVPVKCIQVDSPTHTYLASPLRIPTHNTDRLAATIVAYEALCGGHESQARKGRPVICFQIAQDTRMAKYSLHSIKQTLEAMPFVKAGSTQSMITTVTADRIELRNSVTVAVTPPTVKSIRGYDSPVAVLDEVGVWYQLEDSANPDFEIYNQVSSRQAQFQFPKIIGISSPWNRAGLLYQRYEAGTEGSKLICPRCRGYGLDVDCRVCKSLRKPHRNRLVLHATTAASNPIIPRVWLEESRSKDPRVFERECLAIFQDSMSGFLSSALIERARDHGITKRPRLGGFHYVAAIDPAFRKDAFGFTVVHADPALGVVQDFSKRWHDPTGTPLDPADVFIEIAAVLSEYGISAVFSDQYTIEALNYIAQQHGFSIEEVTFSATSKAEIYANLQQLLNQNKLKLLDDQETINELKSIEKRNTQAGRVMISAPEGLYDDMATVLAIAAKESVWMLPKQGLVEPPPKTMIEKHLDQTMQQRQRYVRESQYDW